MMNSKRGIIGSLIVMFITTIAIVIILTIFVLGSGIVKKFDNVDAGISIYNETRIGLSDVFDYMNDYFKVAEVRSLVADGKDLGCALAEVGYNE